LIYCLSYFPSRTQFCSSVVSCKCHNFFFNSRDFKLVFLQIVYNRYKYINM
jgi:hypothetical protein